MIRKGDDNVSLRSSPSITVVLPTCNRGESVAAAIKSILASDGPKFALHIVDQSDNDLTEKLVRGLRYNSAVRYFRTPTKGASAARNIGIAEAHTELIALTDDDCEVPTTWLLELKNALESSAEVGIAFGNVLAGKHDNQRGFIPTYVRNGACLIRKMAEIHKAGGIGACMGLRRNVWTQLAGFDDMLGVGSRFRSAEELDFAIRALQAGYWIYETDRVSIVHNGFRTWAEAQRLTYDYLYGIGAVFAKHLRCRRWSVFAPLYRLGWRWAFREPLLNYGRFPTRKLRLRAFLAGFRAAMGCAIDSSICRFA